MHHWARSVYGENAEKKTTGTGFPRSWKILEKIVVMESHGKVLEYENFPKSHGKVMELLLLMAVAAF